MCGIRLAVTLVCLLAKQFGEVRNVHRTVVAVDVEGFGNQQRTNPHQLVVREALYRAMHRAFARSELVWDDFHHEDRGDGVLVLVPPSVPKHLLVTSVPAQLADALREHNENAAVAARIRLRLAVHAGEVHEDEHGVVGSAVNLTFRLLAASALREALARSSGVLAMIVSDWFFDDVLRHEPSSEPERYRPVGIRVKETEILAWIGLPDAPYPPVSSVARFGPAQAAPRQLPLVGSPFVGRESEQAALTQWLNEPSELSASASISIITGTAGVGKTTLALQWAQQRRDWFPDGQLYVNLRGYDSDPVLTPGQALDGFLHALGVTVERIPSEVDEQAALYRSLLDGKRMLVLLDNARAVTQVRPLLPGSPGCAALVTSRSRLSGLVAREGAHRVGLQPLSPDEAVALLDRIVGSRRVTAEPDAAAELARRCAYLPLALRVAGERASNHPHLTLTDLVDELADEDNRLDVLAACDDDSTEVRAVFSWSYRSLIPAAARMFRLLGLHAGPDISVAAAAALANIDQVTTAQLLDGLAGAHLLEESGRNRFRFHDLLRTYAAERIEPTDDANTAVLRLLLWYLHTADATDRMMTPGNWHVPLDQPPPGCTPLAFGNYQEALKWCETERANLVAATRQAVRHGFHSIGWKLPLAIWGFFFLRRHWPDWLITHSVGLEAARQVHDQIGEIHTLIALGLGHRVNRHYREAIRNLTDALDIATKTGDRWGEAASLCNLAITHCELDSFDEAARCADISLTITREISERWGESWALSPLGDAYRGLGRLPEALDCYQQALTIRQDIGDRWGEGLTWHDIGTVHSATGRFADAVVHHRQSIAICQEVGNRYGEAFAHYGLGTALHELDDHVAAADAWSRALAIFDELDDPQAAEVRARLTEGP